MQAIKAATVLLDWLTARGLTLATARQADLEAWLSSEHATYRADAGNFIRWARKHKLWLAGRSQASLDCNAAYTVAAYLA